MITVDEARAHIARAISPLDAEECALDHAAGRTLAETVLAQIAQSPFDASAMDGYAVRIEDCALGAPLRVIGESAAGKRFDGRLKPGTAVRIFTGAPVPPGADHILIQEAAERIGDRVTVRAAQPRALHIREAGRDFKAGAALAAAGERLEAARVALIAAGNIERVSVRRAPKIALIANGDELKPPGATLGPNDIVCSIPVGLKPMIESWGGICSFLGVARDEPTDIAARIDRAVPDFDIIVPIGGASVGDRDLMRAAFNGRGLRMIFEKVSVRPGKPTWFGTLDRSFVLGLPGNPASALVTARLFLKAAIAAALGRDPREHWLHARATRALEANGPRETYLRASARMDAAAVMEIRPFDDQDSSLLSVLADANALIRRPAQAPAAAPGALVQCLRL